MRFLRALPAIVIFLALAGLPSHAFAAAVGDNCANDQACAGADPVLICKQPGGTCQTQGGPGAACTRDAECSGLGCQNNVCIGCFNNVDCNNGQQCQNNQCVTPCRTFGQQCTPGGTPSCCAGPAACQHNVFNGQYACQMVTPPNTCMPVGQQCDPSGTFPCCEGVCNMGLCVIPYNPPYPPSDQGTGIKLLEPIGNVTEIPTTGLQGFGPFAYFFNLLYPWFLGLGAAVAVLMGLIGGIQIMTSGGNDALHSEGMNRFLLSLGGLVLLLFSSLILNLLNPTFFK